MALGTSVRFGDYELLERLGVDLLHPRVHRRRLEDVELHTNAVVQVLRAAAVLHGVDRDVDVALAAFNFCPEVPLIRLVPSDSRFRR